jgi:hypothetical protein
MSPIPEEFVDGCGVGQFLALKERVKSNVLDS